MTQHLDGATITVEITTDPFLAIGAAILLHEVGHLTMARIAGVRGACVSLLGFHPGCGTDAQNLVVALAGPVLNLVLAIFGAFSYYEHGIPLAGWFAMANAILGIHNLLPVPHSDGARVVELVRRMKDSAVSPDQRPTARCAGRVNRGCPYPVPTLAN